MHDNGIGMEEYLRLKGRYGLSLSGSFVIGRSRGAGGHTNTSLSSLSAKTDGI